MHKQGNKTGRNGLWLNINELLLVIFNVQLVSFLSVPNVSSLIISPSSVKVNSLISLFSITDINN